MQSRGQRSNAEGESVLSSLPKCCDEVVKMDKDGVWLVTVLLSISQTAEHHYGTGALSFVHFHMAASL